MQDYLPTALPDFSRAKLLVVGDIMLDRYWFGETNRISPEAPVPIVKVDHMDNRPGGAANVALNIAALGASISLLGITGQDEAAERLKDQLSAALVTHDLIALKQLATIIKLRVISRQQQLIRLDFEENLIPAHPDLLTRYEQQLKNADVVILSDYHKGTLSDPQCFIQLARKASLPVLVDHKSQDFSLYQNATLITPNLKEFEAVVGPCANEQAILDKGRALLKAHQIEALLITRGHQGMTLIEVDHHLHLPAVAREVLDVTGAGDTVIATLGTALAAGLQLTKAVALANLAASLTVCKLGAATVSSPELQFALTGHRNATGIVNEEQLKQAVDAAKAEGKKVVFTNGCFDILHVGHVTSLQMAKALGDYLIVAVNTDESVQKTKGKSRPINNLEHRQKVLASLGVVDWVIAFADDTPERLLTLIKPDVLVKGGDYTIDQVVGADIVRAYGGDVHIVASQYSLATSSSAIIDKIIHHAKEEGGI